MKPERRINQFTRERSASERDRTSHTVKVARALVSACIAVQKIYDYLRPSDDTKVSTTLEVQPPQPNVHLLDGLAMHDADEAKQLVHTPVRHLRLFTPADAAILASQDALIQQQTQHTSN